MSDNPHLLLLLSAKAQLSRGEQTVDDQYILVDAIVDEFGLAILADDEQRRHFSLGNTGRELDKDLAAIIVGIDRTPWRAVALDDVTVAALICIMVRSLRTYRIQGCGAMIAPDGKLPL